MLKVIPLFLVIILSISGCSVAPVNTSTTARSLGKDQNIVVGNALPLGVKYSRGTSDNLELGGGIEEQVWIVYHLFAKYTHVNNQDNGLSFASQGGFGYGPSLVKSKSFYFGPIVSYRASNIEFFGAYKLNHVQWKFSGLSSKNKDDLISIPSTDNNFLYHQFDIGMTFINNKFVTTVGLRDFIFPNNSTLVPFLDFGYRF